MPQVHLLLRQRGVMDREEMARLGEAVAQGSGVSVGSALGSKKAFPAFRKWIQDLLKR